MPTDPNGGICKCGCGQKTNMASSNSKRYGWVKGEPFEYIHGHTPFKNPPGYEVQETGFGTPCWLWTGSINAYGHPMLGKRYAHRAFYKEQHGEIEKGLDLHHLCEQTRCVNPEHLLPIKHGHHVRLHRGIPLEIVEAVRRATGSQREIAARLGISKTTVSRIQRGEWWPDS